MKVIVLLGTQRQPVRKGLLSPSLPLCCRRCLGAGSGAAKTFTDDAFPEATQEERSPVKVGRASVTLADGTACANARSGEEESSWRGSEAYVRLGEERELGADHLL